MILSAIKSLKDGMPSTEVLMGASFIAVMAVPFLAVGFSIDARNKSPAFSCHTVENNPGNIVMNRTGETVKILQRTCVDGKEILVVEPLPNARKMEGFDATPVKGPER